MKLFVDTGSVEEVRKAAETGLLDGVTTNPSLIAKQGKDFHSVLKEMVKVVTKYRKDAVVNAEVVSTDFEGMIKEARKLAKLSRNIVVKIPMLPEGMRAVQKLKKEGIRTNVTLVFTPGQALLAAKAGAYFISPFMGRLDDIQHSGLQVAADCVQIMENYGFESQVLTASVRVTSDVLESALMGAHVCTMPYKNFMKLFQHPLTDSGLEAFLEDWRKYKRK